MGRYLGNPGSFAGLPILMLMEVYNWELAMVRVV